MKLKVVADANILISALIKRGFTLDLLFSNRLEVATPEYVFEEIEKHLKEVTRKSGLSRREISLALKLIEARIQIIPKEEFRRNLAAARRISPDSGDTPYIALALMQGTLIWSNDKRLRKQDKVKILSTKELIQNLADGGK